jgi:RNA polymerase sigma-70 factor (ECF subfamily)
MEEQVLAIEKTTSCNEGELKMKVDRIEAAIEKLDAKMRCSFQMYFDGYHYQEIADELHEPIGTIKSRIHQARVNLKKELVEYRMAS